ncbi:hypothetical protein F5J12DRAFT_63297 [Pisolithus orientalis]|uniref:uncharacterized protein n=1 Tax=Pisolithus orientalis TaxID=936130 RepID=UPI0022250542|nr:uncharacterized protein F5J12DRAFT_63297 [Pisolithus orientalis]KAI5984912.1 hypothetical protein F5J12DRAFT_63297 [Pisolithus orientalis]
MFCLHHLSNFVGKILFFERLPSMMESDSLSEVSAGSAEEDGLLARAPKLSCADWMMTCNLFKGSWQSSTTLDPHLEVVLPVLCKRCHTLSARSDAPRRYANQMQKVERELKSISQTLSADLLQHILRVFRNAWFGHALSETSQASCIEYDRQLDIPSMIKEVQALQAKLDATVDEDEQRALEEDVTGKARVRSTCHVSMLRIVLDLVAVLVWDMCGSRPTVTKGCGLHSERGKYEGQLLHISERHRNRRQQGLREFFFAMHSTDPGDDQAHSQR